MLVLSKCPTTLRWTLLLRGSALPLWSATPSSQLSTTARLPILRTQAALFHQSEAKASPELNKPSTGKNNQSADKEKTLTQQKNVVSDPSMKGSRSNLADYLSIDSDVQLSSFALDISASFSLLILQCCPLGPGWTQSCLGWGSGRWDSVPSERHWLESSWPTPTCVCLKWPRLSWSTLRMLTCAPPPMVGARANQPQPWLKAFGELLQQRNQSSFFFLHVCVECM